MDRRVLEDVMTLPTLEEARSWRGLMLVADGDEPIGRIDAVYLDRTTRKPEWVLVNTGLFGSARTFVPLAGATKLGDTVRVPHDPRVVREAPRLERDVDLSESDEARLYAHYGIDYTTSVSPSGLPATESGTDATAELPEAAGTPPPTATRRLEVDELAWSGRLDESERLWLERSRRGRRRPLLAGLAALALAAVGSGLALLRARRRRPKTFGERLAKAGRDAADTLSSTASAIAREAAAVGAADRARQAASGGRRAARRAATRAAAGGTAAAAGGRWAARRAGGAGRQAATEGRRFARRAGKEAAEAAAGTKATVAAGGTKAAVGSRRFARRAGKQATEAATGTKATVAAAGTKAAEAATETKAAVAAKRASRRRARARKRAAATAAGTARSLTAFPTAAGRRMQRLGLDERGRKAREQARKAVPRRRRRSKMKVMGKLGMAVGAAVGYVLGAKAGRERYEQIAASARQFMDKPQVKRVMESAPGNLGARMEQVANKAADAVHQAGDKVAAPSSTGTGAEATPATSTPSTTAGPTPVPSATGGAETGTTGGTTTRRSGSSSRERSKNS
jgi:PRC-barrel domain